MRRASAVTAGFAALTRWRLVLLLTLSAAVLGGLAASVLGPSMRDAFSGTLAGDHLIRNHPEFAPSDALDFLREKAAAISGWGRATLWAGLLGVLLQIFFAGGIVETLGRAAPVPRDGFWAASRRHFGHNLKCFVLFALAAGISLGLWLSLSGAILEKAFENAAPHTGGRFVAGLVVWSVAALLFGVWTLLYDFARAARRAAPEIRALAAFRQARRRLRGSWLAGIALLFLWTVLGGAALAGLFAAAWGERTRSGPSVAVNLLLLLLLLAVRPAARVGAWGSVLSLFDSTGAPNPPFTVTPSAEPDSLRQPAVLETRDEPVSLPEPPAQPGS